MCSDSNLSCRTADDEYINLRSESDEAINYIANANNCSAEQQQYIVNCDEYPTIRRSDQCSSEATYQVKNRRWLPSSYTWKVPWILFICSVVQIVVHYTACSDIIDMLMFRPQKKYDLWRFFTYHIIHFERTHLFLNVFLQIIVGLPLETEQGHFRILIVYVCGIVCGAIGSMIVNPTQTIYGSSAAVYSLLFSHFSHCILNWSNISMRILRIIAVFMLFGCDVLVSVLKYSHVIQSTPKVSFAAHFSGAIAGLISGLLIFAKNPNQVITTKNRL